MLKYIEEFGKYVAIEGFKNAKIKDVKKFLEEIQKEKPSNVKIQFFDAEFVATWRHLYFAVLNALTAFKNKYNISKSFEMEAMLYVSAQRQIRKAMGLLGIKPNTINMAVLVVGDKKEKIKATISAISKRINAQADDKVLELSKQKIAIIRKTFEISDTELEAITKEDNIENALANLVIERMALLATQR